MRFGSLFTGICGFDLGFERAGMECAWQVEIDDACRELEARYYPGVLRYGNVKDVGKRNLEPVDLVCGGFPCQDLSIAGKRKGLAGKRSGLWFEFHRILAELEPRWVVIENVPGLLSSNKGRDFAVVLQGLVQLGYGVCWRIFNAEYFGVAQRRRRVFVIGYFRRGCAAQVLFESTSGAWDSPPSRKKREKPAFALAASVRKTGDGHGQGWNSNYVISRPLAHGHTIDHYDESQQTYVLAQNGSDVQVNDLPGALTAGIARQTSGDVIAIRNSGRDCDIRPGRTGTTTQKDVMFTLQAKQQHAVAFDRTRGTASGDVSAPLRACRAASDGVNDAKADAQCVAFNWYRPVLAEAADISPTLQDSGGMTPAVGGRWGVRRLTPTECERLQGFPDGWTAGQSDTARYRQLGNAVCVPVAEWIGRRIMQVESALDT